MFYSLNLIVDENEKTYELSKISGTPLFPYNFIENNNLEDDLFIAQINLKTIDNEYLKFISEGFIYIFLNVDVYPYKVKCFYSKDDAIMVYEDINEGFEEYIDVNGYEMVLNNEKKDIGICTKINPIISEEYGYNDDYLNLLEIDTLEFNNISISSPDSILYFIIRKEDLKKLDFKKIIFIEH